MPKLAVLMLVLGMGMGFWTGRQFAPPPAPALRDTLVLVQHRLDTIYRTRRERYDSVLTAYVTLRVTDTIMRADTVYIRRDMADSIVKQCGLVIVSCETRVANARAQIDALNAQWHASRRKERALTYAVPLAFVLGAIVAH